MPYLVGILAALCVTLLLVSVYELTLAPARAVAKELEELRSFQPSPFGGASRRRRQSQKQKLGDVIRQLGERVERGGLDVEGWARKLVQAGIWNPEAARIFFGVRAVSTAGLVVIGMLVGVLFDARLMATLFLGVWLGAFGWLAPGWYVLRRRTLRRQQIHRALADALRNLAERTELEDVDALASTLIQTERFGTSVGRALRVQAGALRQKRRQRAEEAAAKTTIKLVFPLVLFVFPALFVVVLGPAVIQVVQALAGMG